MESDSPLSANEIKSNLKISLSQSSSTLKELWGKNLIICLNPDDKIGKLYQINEDIGDVLSELFRDV